MSQHEDYINDYHGMDLYLPVYEGKRDNENGILFYAQYLMLKDSLGKLTQEDRIRLNLIIRKLRTYRPEGTRVSGLFDRGAGESLKAPDGKADLISHDNISAIVAASATFNLPYHMYVYKHGVDNNWRFDNQQPDNPRWSRMMHPRDIIYWSRLGGSSIGKSIAWLFMWFFYLTQIMSCAKKTHVRPSLFHRVRTFVAPKRYPDSGYRARHYAASGKLLAFVRLYPLRKRSFVARLVWKLCMRLIKLHGKGGLAYAFKSHYENRNSKHPNVLMSRQAQKKGKL